MGQARGQLGILREVSYWRTWETVDYDLGGGYRGVAVLECGHTERVRASRHNGYRRGGQRWALDDLGRPRRCFCLACRIERETA